MTMTLIENDDILIAAEHNPELAAEYARVEAAIGFPFKKDFTMELDPEALRLLNENLWDLYY